VWRKESGGNKRGQEGGKGGLIIYNKKGREDEKRKRHFARRKVHNLPQEIARTRPSQAQPRNLQQEKRVQVPASKAENRVITRIKHKGKCRGGDE